MGIRGVIKTPKSHIPRPGGPNDENVFSIPGNGMIAGLYVYLETQVSLARDSSPLLNFISTLARRGRTRESAGMTGLCARSVGSSPLSAREAISGRVQEEREEAKTERASARRHGERGGSRCRRRKKENDGGSDVK